MLEFRVQDGDAGDWRKLLLTIVSDPRQYFVVEPRGVDARGVHVARLLTSANLIDREEPASGSGLYTVVLNVSPLILSPFNTLALIFLPSHPHLTCSTTYKNGLQIGTPFLYGYLIA